jgi:hypothetical protein
MKSSIVFPILLVAGALVLLVYVAMNQPAPLQRATEIQVVDEGGDVVMVVSSGGNLPSEDEEDEGEVEPVDETGEGEEDTPAPATPRAERAVPPANNAPQGDIPQGNAPETNYNPSAADQPAEETEYR